ncbi:MAG: arginine deiminase family protein [Firmicutes bacterium]|nr:arginine deiminase family protein [Bacillota bacterium]
MSVGSQSMVDKIQTVVIKHARDAYISQEYLEDNWKKWGFFSCPDYEKCVKEYNEFEKIIKKLIPDVKHMPKDEEAGLDSIYSHDSVKFTKKGAIILNMGKATRKNEPKSMKSYLESINVPILGEITGHGTVEGGDVLWLEDNKVAIGRGYRTNDEGIKQFKELVKDLVDDVIVVPMPHGNNEEECLHLMSVISPIDKDLAVVYSRYMPVFFRQMLISKGIKLIEVIDEEYMPLGTNVLTVEPRKVVLMKGNQDIKEKLLNEGVEVYEYEGKHISLPGNGGATCMTAPLYRV